MKIFLSSKKKKSNLIKSDTDAAILKAQSERIEDLKRELNKLSHENKKLRDREEGVTDALSIAKQKARDYLEEAKIRFALECERLEGYRRQWTSYIKDLSTAKDLGLEVINTEKKLRECAEEMQGFINEDFPFATPAYENFMQESERINPKEASLGSLETSFSKQDETMLMSDEELKGLIVQLLNKGN
jgi:hypothetical protein